MGDELLMQPLRVEMTKLPPTSKGPGVVFMQQEQGMLRIMTEELEAIWIFPVIDAIEIVRKVVIKPALIWNPSLPSG
jgi:hypothetical protein